MKQIKCSAIVFDLDGVLIDSKMSIERCWRSWAGKKGLDPAPFLRVAHGRQTADTIRLVAPELDAEAEAAKLGVDPVVLLLGGVASGGCYYSARLRTCGRTRQLGSRSAILRKGAHKLRRSLRRLFKFRSQ